VSTIVAWNADKPDFGSVSNWSNDKIFAVKKPSLCADRTKKMAKKFILFAYYIGLEKLLYGIRALPFLFVVK
ncbi:MAG: hypothetical protein IJQ02_09840, partial [Oscillospiraceae bacterium]|nr:hypothetical protein [Oscillospiraceae bacterium]